MDFTITITPGLNPMDRGTLEDMLCERVPGIDCVGGGTLLTEPIVSDSQFETHCSADEVREAVKAVYGAIEFTLPTEITLEIDGVEERV